MLASMLSTRKMHRTTLRLNAKHERDRIEVNNRSKRKNDMKSRSTLIPILVTECAYPLQVGLLDQILLTSGYNTVFN